MNNFEEYYNGQFRKDILTFFSKIPERSKHTFENKNVFTVQYQSLTKDFDYLDFLAEENKAYFGVALFFTVLIDQVCYTYYQDHYYKFERLTCYPKFVGNSPSTDRTNLNPRDIFGAINYSRDKEKMFNTENVKFWNAFNKAKPVMETETMDFFKNYLSDIDGHEFWQRCEQEFPFHP